MIKIPAELRDLAEIFNDNKAVLYIVGGYVRDSWLKISSQLRDDIDLCSNVTPDRLKKMLKGTKFEVKNINEPLGVVAICGKRRYEYATFRKEIYESESHTPDRVEFIGSLEEDARRRDFKINAIYFDILAETYVDPVGGIDDLRNREITTVKVPKLVFNDDPERILRLIRFATSLGLNIPEEEMFYAKQNVYKLRFISQSRLRAEFNKLLVVDTIYPDLLYTKNAHVRAMILIGELDAWKYILPVIDDMMKTNITDFKGERIYDHIINCLRNASPQIRLATLLHDVGKFKTMELQKTFLGSQDWVGVILDKNLGVNGLGYPKAEVERLRRIIIGYDFNKKGLASPRKTRRFIVENSDVIEEIIEVKNVVTNEGKQHGRKVFSATSLQKHYKEMKNHNIALSLSEMNLSGEDIIQEFPKIKLETINTLLNNVLIKAAAQKRTNSKESLLLVAKRVINSKRDFYLEK